jgi:hypothetical protein
MKKLFLILLLSPLCCFAQNEIVDLTSYGLKATLSNSDNTTFTVKADEDMGSKEYSIYFGDNKIKVTDYAKPMTVKKVLDIYRGLPKEKSKSTKFKLIEQSPTKVVLERTIKGEIDYLFFYGYVVKGKQIIVEGTSIKDLETCKALQKIAATFKMN